MRRATVIIVVVALGCLTQVGQVRGDHAAALDGAADVRMTDVLAVGTGRASTTWTAGDSWWDTSGNWSNGEPGATDWALVVNGGTARIRVAGEVCEHLTIGPGTVRIQDYGDLTLDDEYGCTIGGSGAGQGGYFIQETGTADFGFLLNVGQQVTEYGSYSMQNGELYVTYLWVGYGGTGHFTHYAGDVNPHVLEVGVYEGSVGEYTLSGGALTASTAASVGGNDGGDGTFNHNGGTFATGNLRITGGSSNGIYTISGGTLDVRDGRIDLRGTSPRGALVQTGGTVIADEIQFIDGGGSYTHGAGSVLRVNYITGTPSGIPPFNGTLQIGHSGGGVGYGYHETYTDISIGNDFIIGYDAQGWFNHYDGTVTAGAPGMYSVCIGQMPGSSGAYVMDAGSLSCQNTLEIGRGGGSGFSQYGGSVSVSADAYMARELGSGGSCDLYDGTFTVDGTFHMASADPVEYAWLDIESSGGSAGGDLTANMEVVGEYGSCAIQQSAGSNTVTTDLSLGYESGSLGTYSHSDGTCTVGDGLYLGHLSGSEGSYDLSQTGALAASDEYVGYSGTGTFTQTGGSNTVSATLHVGYSSGSSGTYALSAPGEVEADTEVIGVYGTGDFTQTDGSNHVITDLRLGQYLGSDGSYELQGGELLVDGSEYVGDGGKGSFTQSGGDNFIANDLCIGYPDTNSIGLYVLEGGWLWAGGAKYVGYRGNAKFKVTGGQNDCDLYLGYFPRSRGYCEILGGITNAEKFYVGHGGKGVLDVQDESAEINVSEELSFGKNCSLRAVPGTTVRITGTAMENKCTDPAAMTGLNELAVVFEGGSGHTAEVEVCSEDVGAVPEGLESNFALRALTEGGVDVGRVRLVDYHDNLPDWTGQEVLYVQDLEVGANCYLDLSGHDLYYAEADIDSSAVIELNGGELIKIVGTLVEQVADESIEDLGETDWPVLEATPNPFNPLTTIRYTVASPGHVSLEIYDSAGRLIRVLVDRHQASDRYSVTWDGRDEAGHDAGSGVYFYRLVAGTVAEMRKMVLVK